MSSKPDAKLCLSCLMFFTCMMCNHGLCADAITIHHGPAAMSNIIDEPESDLSLEATVEFATRKLTYGLVDNRDPIFTLEGVAEWHGFTFESSIEFETTSWGRKHGGYGNRKGTFQEVCFGPGYTFTLSDEHISFLPTEIELYANYIYEFHAPIRRPLHDENPNMQFFNFGVELPELWLSPWFTTEVDVGAECGSVYFNTGVQHTFTLIPSCEARENGTLELTVCNGLGFGNPKRNRYDSDFNAFAVKDMHVSLALEWYITDNFMIGPYIAVYEQLHRRVRQEARRYIDGESHASTQVLGGFIMQCSF